MSELQLDKYSLHEELGRGGYGTVYRATDNVLEVPRAVKVLHPALAADPAFIERFRREAKFAARMKHPHIVRVYDLGEAEARFFLAMDYLPGGSVKDLLAQEGRLPWERALEITRQIAEALDHIYAQGLVHRDVKPGNILFDAEGIAALSDLGFAKAMSGAGSASLSVTGGMIGTPAYMAPEIWLGQEASPQSDTYSLACVLVEMLTGESLFGAGENTPPPLVMKRHFDPLELPADWTASVPPGINAVLENALTKEPDARTLSPGDFVSALLELTQEPQPEPIEVVSEISPVSQLPRNEPDTSVRIDTRSRTSNFQPSTQSQPFSHLENSGETLQPATEKKSWWQHPAVWIVGVGLAISGVWSLVSQQPEYITIVETVMVEGVVETVLVVVEEEGAVFTTPVPVITSEHQIGIGSTQISSKDGMVQVFVPAGEFEMGSNEYHDEKPIHTVYLDAFWIDQTEVTNAMYEQCVNAGECDLPRDRTYYDDHEYADHPVVYVSWTNAQNYCTWTGRRLPTEAEWEKAARGGLEGMKYPWGDENPVCTPGAENGAEFGDCGGRTVKVSTFAPNGYGLYDMVGNVWEWVADWYERYYYDNSPYSNPPGPASGDSRGLRGGSWNIIDGYVRSANRKWSDPSDSWNYYGFRCARSE
jgi:eukaryotic-like serine/threonine-protein kinase